MPAEISEELAKAIASVRQGLRPFKPLIPTGAVVKHKQNQNIGVVKIACSGHISFSNSYRVYWVQVEGVVAQRDGDFVLAWVDEREIEELILSNPSESSL